MTIWNVYDKKQIERKRISKTANAIGGAFLIGFALSEILQRIILKQINDYTYLNNPGVQWVLQIVLSTLMFTVPFIIMTNPMNVRISTVCNFAKPKKGLMLPVVLAGIGISMLSNVLGSMATSIFEMIGFSNDASSMTTETNSQSMIFVILIAGSVLPGLIEEFALRGVVLGSLKKFGNNFAILISAALFGIMHGNFAQIPFAFIMGLYLGFAVIKTGSVWTSVFIHIINNLFAFGLEIVSGMVGKNTFGLVNCIYFLIAVFLGFLGLYIARNRKSVFSIKPDKPSELSLGAKISAVATAPCIILTIVYVVYEIIMLLLVSLLQ